MRILHTSDWHLGRSFFGVSMLEDQAHVLDCLFLLAKGARLDAILIAGDVYDRSNPPADAVRLLDDTLMRLVAGAKIPVVLIAGNHDSADRLGFGARLLASGGLHVAGAEPRVLALDDAHGPVEIFAIPFAEPPAVADRYADRSIVDHEAALRAQLGGAGSSATDGLRQRGTRGRRIAVAHAFVSGGAASESERPLVVGGSALIPASCFDGFDYAALGHLHRPQHVGRREVRYSGSLLKYSFDEAAHRKSVSIVEMDDAGGCTIEEVALPARRDVRVLEGTLEELQRAASRDTARDDYVLAKLTDRGAVLDPIGKLRLLYPNCLRVDRDAFLAARTGARISSADPRRDDEGELFGAFFREVTGGPPDDAEARAFTDALSGVRRTMLEA